MHSANLQEIVVLLLVAIFIVTIFKRLHLSPVLGYLVAGGAIGPFGLSIIHNIETTKYIAEFGVVFLLFYIGLELTFDRIKSMRLHVFGFGTAQMLITTFAIGIIAHRFGVDSASAIIIGGGLALSSTAIVLQVMAEQGEQSTQVGRLSVAVLILQDLAVVPLLIMVPLLATDSTGNIYTIIIDAVMKAAIVLLIIFVVGRRFLRPIYHLVGSIRSQELFVATTLLLVLGTAWATREAGLSLALGAFVAGLLVAETEYRPQVETDIEPFKGLLMGLFFMTIGMSFDFRVLADKLFLVFFFTIMLILGKSLIIGLLARAFGFRSGASVQAGLSLSQGSEFSFVLFGLAVTKGVFDQELSQILMVTVSISMAFTPLLSILGKKLSEKIDSKDPIYLKHGDITKETLDLHDHIIVAGYGRVGKTICSLLSAKNIGNYIAIDSNPNSVHEGRKEGKPVYYGNIERVEILKTIGIDRARIIVITISKKEAAIRAVKSIHKSFPDIPIVARAWDRKHADNLRAAGAKVAMAEAFESSLLLGGTIMKTIGTPENEIALIIEQFRAEEYPVSQEKELFFNRGLEAKK